MAWINRDAIWRSAWACAGVAIVLNLAFLSDVERTSRLSRQAQVDADAGQWASAAPRYARAAELDSTALTAFNAGAAYLHAGDWNAAEHWFQEALHRDPGHGPSREGLAQVEQFRSSR